MNSYETPLDMHVPAKGGFSTGGQREHTVTRSVCPVTRGAQEKARELKIDRGC